MQEKRIGYLLKIYLRNECSEEEREELAGYLQHADEKELLAWMQEAWKDFEPDEPADEATADKMLAAIIATEKAPIKKLPLYKRQAGWQITAVLMLMIGIGYWFTEKHTSPKTIATHISVPEKSTDVLPGSNKAVLTLANGSQVILDSAGNGVLAAQGNATIHKLNGGHLTYESSNANKSVVLFNTISVPKGGQYQLTLADGTKVWLNAASSLRFPVSFTGKERKVEMTGEAYFEVAKNKNMPFYVQAKDAQIEVLGTHFNINAYDDESIMRTSLLEGSVKVSRGNNAVVIKPGEQAQVKSTAEIKVKNNIDVEEVTAWKDGFFQFNSASLEDIMKQAERWYDIEVQYQGSTIADHFSGKISRSVNLSQLLAMLQYSGVHFTINDRKVTIIN